MKKRKVVLAAVVLVILFAGIWMYWEWEMPLKALLPEENYHIATLVGIELRDGMLKHVQYTVDEKAEDDLVAALDTVKINRTTREDSGGFWLVLYSEKHGNLVGILVSENGILNMNEQKFEGGEELYEYLHQLVQSLPTAQ